MVALIRLVCGDLGLQCLCKAKMHVTPHSYQIEIIKGAKETHFSYADGSCRFVYPFYGGSTINYCIRLINCLIQKYPGLT